MLLAMSLAASVFAGDIQVSCGPDLRVYLDGKLAGVSSAKEDGLYLANVPDGLHVVRVEKDGFASQTFRVQVSKVPVEVKVGAFAPQAPASREAETSVAKALEPPGLLVVTSAPQNCVVEVDGKPETKSAPLMRVQGLATGEHSISFSKQGYDRLAGSITMRPGAALNVHGDLIAGKLETVYEGQGSLRVYSTPEHCTIRILGMTKEKIRATLNLSHLPAGEHRLVARWAGREQSSSIVISNGQRTIVTVSFVKGAPPFAVRYEPE